MLRIGIPAVLLIAVALLSARAQENKDKPFQVDGKLAEPNPKDPKPPTAEHKFAMKAGAAYVIDMKSTEVDSFLKLFDPTGNQVGEDDDSGGGIDAQISVKARLDGEYKIVCTCYGSPRAPLKTFGKYTLSAHLATADELKRFKEPDAGGFATIWEVLPMLKKLGFEPTVFGRTRCWISVNRGDTPLQPYFELSGSRKILWIMLSLGELKSPEMVSAKTLRLFVQENEKIIPAQFIYDAPNKSFLLSEAVANRDWTPAKLKKEIEQFEDVARKTRPLWQFDRFLRVEDAPPDVAAPELAKLAGEWKRVEIKEGTKTASAEETARRSLLLTIKGSQWIQDFGTGKLTEMRIEIDPTREPKAFDLIEKDGKFYYANYKIENDKLTIHFSLPDEERSVGPDAFASGRGDLWVLERKK